MNYMLITSEVLSRLSDLFISRALIVMIVWTCSYKDMRSYYEPDVVVRWFLGEYKSKSEIHRRAKKFREEVKTLFKEYAKEALHADASNKPMGITSLARLPRRSP